MTRLHHRLVSPGFRTALRLAAGAGAAITLSACAYTPVSDADRPLYRPPVGTVVTLNENLEVPKGYARVFIQDGQVHTRRRDVDEYYPYCAFEVNRNRDALQKSFKITKGSFTVERSWKDVDYAGVSFGTGSWTVAASSGSSSEPRRWIPFPDERGQETMATFMRLASSDQPAVHQLVCGIFADRVAYNHLTLNEIKQTLGDVTTLDVPGS